ncbi:hypothetical protein GCM10010254_04210 [Streptomyces chromofuscus]|nr:hypothetical protein GCM10010254_04210 [Streptomyces chromofuscus]
MGISVLSLLPASMLAFAGVREYREGGSVYWAAAGIGLVLLSVHVLVRDIRAVRADRGGSR